MVKKNKKRNLKIFIISCLVVISCTLGIGFYLRNEQAIHGEGSGEKEPPILIVEDKSFFSKSTFEPLKELNFTAYDSEGKDLTSKVYVVLNEVNSKKDGSYRVILSVKDENKTTTRKLVHVIVKAEAIEVSEIKKKDEWIVPSLEESTTKEVNHPKFEDELIPSIIAKGERFSHPKINYSVYGREDSWQPYKTDGEIATVSRDKKIVNGVKIAITNLPTKGDVEYRTYLQEKGWQDFVTNNQVSGNAETDAPQIEAIQMRLTDRLADYYNIYYRVRVEKIGWLGWAKNGESAGSERYNYPLEALEIELKTKEDSMETKEPSFIKQVITPDINYAVQLKKDGWVEPVKNGATIGTKDETTNVVAIQAQLTNLPTEGSIEYQTAKHGEGFQEIAKDNAVSGDMNQEEPIEALRLSLTGKLATLYDVYYRTYVQNYGWLGWAKNGESSGTEDYGYQIEGLEVILVNKKTGTPPKKSKFSPFYTLKVIQNKAKFIMHRGFSSQYPENTLLAFEKAEGAWGCETDIQLTQDGEWVVMHDKTVNRMTNGKGHVYDLTLAEIKSYDINSGVNIELYGDLKVPTLDEYLEVMQRKGLIPVIEIKGNITSGYDKLIESIRKYGFEKTCRVISFDYNALTQVRMRSQDIQLQFLVDAINSETLKKCQVLQNCDIDSSYYTVSPLAIEEAHRRNLKVNVWTVNSIEKTNQLIKQGVDYVTTDLDFHHYN